MYFLLLDIFSLKLLLLNYPMRILRMLFFMAKTGKEQSFLAKKSGWGLFCLPGAVTSAGSPTGTCVGSVMAPPSKLLFPTMEGRTRHVQPDSRCGRQRRLPTPASADDSPNAGRQPHGPGIGSVPEPTRGDGHLAKRKSPSHFSSLKKTGETLANSIPHRFSAKTHKTCLPQYRERT